jgi:hypothetical protein
MRLIRLVYASRVAAGVDAAAIRAILGASQNNNARDGISGMLCFSSGVFLQCLEGPRPAVNRTYHRILADPRHSEAEILGYQEISQRDFDDWSMGYIGEGLLAGDTLFRYGASRALEPSALSAESAWGLLRALAEQARRLHVR